MKINLNNDNTFLAFNSEKPDHDSPDYRGVVMINGYTHPIAFWVKHLNEDNYLDGVLDYGGETIESRVYQRVKLKDGQPDYQGKMRIQDQHFGVSAWVKIDKKNDTFISGAINEPRGKRIITDYA